MAQIAEFVVSLGPWNWLIAGLALLLLEVAVPGVLLMWFGLAAIIVGLIGMVVDVAWQVQIVAFAVIAMGLALIVRRYATGEGTSEDPLLNARTAQLVGRMVSVVEAIDGGRGRVKVGDGVWSAEGPDMPEGSRAKVVGVTGTTLKVEPV